MCSSDLTIPLILSLSPPAPPHPSLNAPSHTRTHLWHLVLHAIQCHVLVALSIFSLESVAANSASDSPAGAAFRRVALRTEPEPEPLGTGPARLRTRTGPCFGPGRACRRGGRRSGRPRGAGSTTWTSAPAAPSGRGPSAPPPPPPPKTHTLAVESTRALRRRCTSAFLSGNLVVGGSVHSIGGIPSGISIGAPLGRGLGPGPGRNVATGRLRQTQHFTGSAEPGRLGSPGSEFGDYQAAWNAREGEEGGGGKGRRVEGGGEGGGATGSDGMKLSRAVSGRDRFECSELATFTAGRCCQCTAQRAAECTAL